MRRKCLMVRKCRQSRKTSARGMEARAAAEAIFREGVRAVQPGTLMNASVSISGETLILCGNNYSLGSFTNIYVTGAGKATADMARALESILGRHISGGIIAVKYEHELPLKMIRQVSAAHPVPDENGLRAAAEIGALLDQAGESDLVIGLFSGGASALMADCPEGISLNDLREVSDLLLRSGAAITEINTVRKHLSTLKGGQLARRAHPARLVSLIISDVVGDDPGVIASGPTSADGTTFEDAWQVLERYRLEQRIPRAVRDCLKKGLHGQIAETPKPGDPSLSAVRNHIIGSNRVALSAAADQADRLGYKPHILGSQAAGPAEKLAAFLLEEAVRYDGIRPACLLLGGESTVEVRGTGKGGRNQHLALAAALALQEKEFSKDRKRITILAAGTDGTDGPTDMAGAVADTATLENARRLGLGPRDFLEACDSYHFFQKTGGHIHTGPTQTNVMDLMLVLIDAP